MSSPRQTLTYLSRRFAEVGIEPDTRHGQNFLIDLNLVRVLVDAAELEPRDVVLEVGTGTGSLTAMLAERAGRVVTVELDRHLYQLATEQLYEFDNVTMLHQDALRNKNNLHAAVLDAVREQMQTIEGARFKLAANLPYNIATPVLGNLLAQDDPVPALMVATIQKELADRITAVPSTKDYSALSIWMQSQCQTGIVRVLPPSVFWPRPKVTSAIVSIRVDPQLRARIPDRKFFHEFVRAMFLHRRKFLRSVLVAAMKNHLGKSDVDEVMTELELGPTTRAEELDVDAMLRLCEAVRARVGSVAIL